MSFELNFPDDFLKGLLDSDVDELASKMLVESAPVLVDSVKKELGEHIDTGEMYRSVKAGKPIKRKDGYSVTVRPTGKDKDGVRNAAKAFYLEYGTSRGEQKKPWVARATKNAETRAQKVMQEVYEKEVK